MKANDYLLITATAAYSYLFFEQNAGINFLIFSLLVVSLLLVKNKDLLKQRKFLWAASLVILSGVFVFINSSALSIIANCTALLLLCALTINIRTSVIFSFLFSVFSVVSSFIYIILDSVKRYQKSPDDSNKQGKGYLMIAILGVLLFSILFFVMFQNANPLFAENTKWINFDFISFSWFAFTFGGFLLVYGLLYQRSIPVIENWENNLPKISAENNSNDIKRDETERLGGLLLFVLLNLMLLVLNIGDILSIWFKGSLPKGISHSDFVHNGVGMVILSIIVALSLIMFLYRKNYSSVKYAGALKILIYTWIIQNLVMLFSTVYRNQIYIDSFNITYKRIGVYVWLALAATGLIITFIKIQKQRSNWYLIRSNFTVWFSVLVFSSAVNWDLLITRFNLNNKPVAQVDFYYLFSLSDANIPELLDIAKENNFDLLKNGMKNYTRYDEPYYHLDYISLLNRKINHFVYDYINDWRSFDLRDLRISKILVK